jgi:hypothetical protein
MAHESSKRSALLMADLFGILAVEALCVPANIHGKVEAALYPQGVRVTVRSLAAFSLLLLVAAGCSATTNPVRDVFAEFGAGPPAATAPDFVAKTRPAELEYIPVGRATAQAPTAARTPAEIAQFEAELEAERLRAESKGAAARGAGAAAAARVP